MEIHYSKTALWLAYFSGAILLCIVVSAAGFALVNHASFWEILSDLWLQIGLSLIALRATRPALRNRNVKPIEFGNDSLRYIVRKGQYTSLPYAAIREARVVCANFRVRGRLRLHISLDDGHEHAIDLSLIDASADTVFAELNKRLPGTEPPSAALPEPALYTQAGHAAGELKKLRAWHWLGLVFALIAAVALRDIAAWAMGNWFENPNPDYWATYVHYWAIGAFFVPPVMVGLIVARRAELFGMAIGLFDWSYAVWLNRHSFIPVGEYLIPMKYLPGFIFEGLVSTLLTALVTCLTVWLWSEYRYRRPARVYLL